MDQQQAEFLGSFWDTDRNVTSQDNNDMFTFNSVFDFAGVHNNVQEFGIQRQFRLTPENSSATIRAPLPSPTSLPPPHGLFPSVLQPFKPSLMLSNYNGNSMATSAAYSAILRPPVRSPMPHFGFMEESPSSTDATPESSDVEEDNRTIRKKKRAKTLLNEEQASKHSEEAQRFPGFLQELRTRLVNESPDNRVQESTAVSALIQAFTRVNDEDNRFTLPAHCEQWLRQASESVQERRQMNKGMRKKRSSDAIIGTGPNERFFCQLCSEHDIKGFKTQEGLNLHIRNKHEADKQWKCFAPGCTVSFVRQADLRMHLIRMHSPQRPFPCKVPFCLKAFAGVSELRRHVKVDHRTIVQHLCGLTPPSSNGNAEA